MKVVYQAGVNEKLLGDFIRKYDVRDKVFGGLLVSLFWDAIVPNYLDWRQLPRNAVSASSREMAVSPILPLTLRSILKAPSSGSALFLTFTICIGWIQVR